MSVQDTPAYRLASMAFRAALKDEADNASRYVQQIADQYGAAGLSLALTAWCDTLLWHACDGNPWEARLAEAPVFLEMTAGQVHTAAEVPEPVRWAARLIQARATRGEQGWLATLRELINVDDGYVTGQYVVAVLEAAAMTLNALPRGYAVASHGR